MAPSLGPTGRLQLLTPTPDFQVEAEEDIKSKTSGTLQDLLLALAKVRTAHLQGKGATPAGKGAG